MANQITILRAFLTPVFITVTVYHQPENFLFRWLPLTVFMTACISDALDGYVARSRNERTLFGQVLDPIADKLLLISGFLSVYFSPHFPIKPPAWVVILVCSRDAFILAGIIVIYVTSGTLRADPSYLGKVTTFFQMITVMVLLIPLRIAPFFWSVTAVLTLASGLSYLRREVERVKVHVAK
ncbi:MAG: CDP-alcohol phosphatidyltransferase family protein [Candidatus Omnitrophica bacterium]|nr:CDP-alcohol phosphatidyltransferase family protein [Candidatus Omnitrophota bacterium]